MVRTRCKYRCLGLNTKWDGASIVQLAPVMASKDHPENQVWWDATPSGEIEILTGPDCMFEVGAYYFVDLERLEEEPSDAYERSLCYRLVCVTDWGGTIEVKLDSGYAQREVSPRRWVVDPGIRKAEFKASINNQDSWPAFVGHVGSFWRVTYTFAGASDDEHNAYT